MLSKSSAFSLALASAAATAYAGSCTTSHNFDYYMLVEQWDISLCSDGTFSCTSDADYFTLHGLWPNDNNGDYPCTCTNEKFDENQIKDLLPSMNQYWLSLSGSSSSFWSHEYEKHGTCSDFSSQHDFFNSTLSLRDQYDVIPALAKAGIVPSNDKGFTLSAFKDAVSAAYGSAPAVQCDSKGNIVGITFCINKNLVAEACPSSTSDECSASELYLPSKMYAGASRAGALRGM